MFTSSRRRLIVCECQFTCPNMKMLALPNLSATNEAEILKLVGKWKELEELEMEMKPFSFLEMLWEINLNCVGFSSLKMMGSIKKGDVAAIVGYLSEIKHICLDKSYFSGEHLVELIGGCRELETMSVHDCVGFEHFLLMYIFSTVQRSSYFQMSFSVVLNEM
ncbi:hypothetical protein Cni_G16134 [Canna indica]|uniref:F-box/LRR-repeat protein n=1 Tax=Canna indica TaxID=4628 RepID=A0AAQ3QFL9_9LILI|nr:hypothetical protein Cni_G16134 [Canna indica]